MRARDRLRKAFSSSATDYDAARPRFPRRFASELLGELRRSSPRVLEIGIGTGLASMGFARRAEEFVGIDPSAAMLTLSRQRLARLQHVRLIESDFERVELPDEHFDLILAAQSFHWLDDSARAVVRCARLLRTHGHLVLAWNFPLLAGTESLSRLRALIVAAHPDFEKLPDASEAGVAQYLDDWRAEVSSSSLYSRVRTRVVERRWKRSPAQLLAWLSTLSWHRTLAPTTARQLQLEARRVLGRQLVNVPLRTIVIVGVRAL